jgi:hypothetical protein
MGVYDDVLLAMNDLEYNIQKALAAQIKAYHESGMESVVDEDKAKEYAIRSIQAHVGVMLARKARN